MAFKEDLSCDNKKSPLVYVIEDDDSIRELLTETLIAFSYEAEAFPTAEEALDACGRRAPSLAIFDLMLPGMDGTAAVKKLRADPSLYGLPVIMLTAKGTEQDKIDGLDAGADDYVTKPFSVMELMSRVKALLRRSRLPAVGSPAAPPRRGILSANGLSLDPETREVTLEGRVLDLTYKEFELLSLLMEQRERVLTRDELLSTVWGYDEFVAETRTLDMHIRSLRNKLGDEADHPRFIRTVRGVGYRFCGGEE